MKNGILIASGMVTGLILSNVEGMPLWQELTIVGCIAVAIFAINRLVRKT